MGEARQAELRETGQVLSSFLATRPHRAYLLPSPPSHRHRDRCPAGRRVAAAHGCLETEALVSASVAVRSSTSLLCWSHARLHAVSAHRRQGRLPQRRRRRWRGRRGWAAFSKRKGKHTHNCISTGTWVAHLLDSRVHLVDDEVYLRHLQGGTAWRTSCWTEETVTSWTEETATSWTEETASAEAAATATSWWYRALVRFSPLRLGVEKMRTARLGAAAPLLP